MQVKGRVALVTGGASGIGKAICEALLKSGAKVCITDIDETSGAETAAGFSDRFGSDHVMFVQCDVSNRKSFAAAFTKTLTKLQGLDIVCNNAGCQLERSNWEKMLHVNLFGVMHGCQLAVEHMGRQNGGLGGVIVNTSSIAGCYSFAQAPAYCTSKAGVNMYTRCFAELVKDSQGIRVCAVCPTVIDTPLVQKSRDEIYNTDKQIDDASVVVLKPEEVANAVLQLITDDSKNGTLLMVLASGCEEFQSPPLDMSKITK